MTIAQDIEVIKHAIAGMPEMENFGRVISYLSKTEEYADNAIAALEAVLNSGEVQQEFAIEMVKRGLNNQPQHL